MRIRKNAKVSPLLYLSHVAAPEDLQPHVCTVNQNPWEVRPLNQLEAEPSSFIGFASGSFNSSVAAESVASMMDDDAEEKTAQEEPEQNGVVEMGSNNSKQLEEGEEDGDGDGNGEKSSPQLCIKNDGRGWHCKKLAVLGQHYCPHHFSLSLHRSNIRNPAAHNCIAPPKKSAPASATVVVEGRARRVRARAKRGSAAANPHEMYFYSGFGPKWSQDRRVRNRDEQEPAEDTINNAAPPVNGASTTSATSSPSGSRHTAPRSTSSSPIRREVEKLDYLDDDEDDEDDFDDVGSGGKRKRRPIKARSLKDL